MDESGAFEIYVGSMPKGERLEGGEQEAMFPLGGSASCKGWAAFIQSVAGKLFDVGQPN